MKKVVSFSLYGSNATYIIGMKENIKLAKQHFPDWEVRIYHNNTVPEKYINEYKELNAICIVCENIGENKLNWEGMFWRWLPLDDPNVNIWISRDADSRLSEREAKIVNQWINSGKTLHTIRDHRCHYNYIMGGMFGINNKLFHEKYKFNTVSQIIKELSVYYKERPYNVDQIFLNDNLWKILKDDVMAHISKDGRRVYPTDILIPSVQDFIGKQYRLNDFPENIIKHLDKNKGCYWKESTSSSVYWSISSIDIKPDVKFNNQGEYFMHRAEHGFPQNWSQIQILDGINIEEKPKEIETKMSLHKMRIPDYNNINNTYLPYKCDWNYANNKLIGDENKQPSTIFIKVEFIEAFYNSYYKKIEKDTKFIVVSGGGDVTIPNNIDIRFKNLDLIKNNKKIIKEMLNDDRLIHWYAENCDELLDKMSGIPTGVINNNKLNEFYNNELATVKKNNFSNKINVLCCHKVRDWTSERKKVNELCKNEWKSLITYKESIPQQKFLDEISKYTFILCVNGGGLDPSPKAFETIIAGSIPIIKKTDGIYSAYKDLPVVFIEDWIPSEITEDKLNNWLFTLRKYYEDDKLRKETLYKLSDEYWWKYINNISLESICRQENNLTVLYGVENKYIDITDKLKRVGENNLIIIPKGDPFRCRFFNVKDPAYGITKHVKIITNNEIKIINVNDSYEFESKEFTNLKNNEWYESIENNYELLLNQIHNKFSIRHGSWDGELPEQLLSLKYIKSDLKVLELGGNIGRNSIIISTLLENQKNLVTIEPNISIFENLKENRDNNNLSFNIESSAISERRLWSKNWHTYITPVDNSIEVSTMSFNNLQKKYNIIFDTLVVDCEGALYNILQDNPNILKNINLIIIENDFQDINHKKFVDNLFKENNLIRNYFEAGEGRYCKENFYEVWEKNLYLNKPYKNVYILDSKDKRINPIVKALFNDLMGGFKRLGFNVITEINKIDDIDDYSIIFVDNSIQNDIIDILCLKNKNCVYFGWCCHELERDFNKLKFIFTTTHTLTPRGKQKELVNNTKNYCPLYHRADEDPNKIGTFERNVIYDWCYTGWKYRDDLIPSKFKGLNKGVKSHMGYLSSDERRKVYLSSFVHLAYVGDTNIKDSAIPQRIFEGLGYGCIVLTNSKPACEHTENIVEYVESLKDVEEKINYYLNNPEEVKKKQELAYEFIKKCGTNYFTIEKLNSKSKELFDIDFLKNIDKNKVTLKEEEQAKICFITANYGSYDQQPWPYAKQTVKTDFIYFTDNKNMKKNQNGWIIDTTPYHIINNSPLDVDDENYVNSLKNNKHTFNIAKYYKQAFINIPRLKKYDVIIWIDGSLEIKNTNISKWILNNIYKHKIITWKWREKNENSNTPLKEEMEASNMYRYTSTRWRGQSQPYQDINKQYKDYLDDGYNENFKNIWITCFVAFLQKDKDIINFLNRWYLQTLKYTTQDQIGFTYICYKENLVPYTLPDNEIKGDGAAVTDFYQKHSHGSVCFIPDKNKGCYWKQPSKSTIYWSNSSIDIKKDIQFKDPHEYFKHRNKHGFPKDWSNINILDGINIEEKESKENIKFSVSELSLSKLPLVSIAISTFESGGKGHELLKHNFDQIFKQDYENIEIVISDHSSDNKIKELCKEYDGKKYPIKYIHNPEYKGNSSQNTNNAIKYCNGEYIKILFMDDYLYNESSITIIVENFEKNADKKWLVHSYKHTKDYKEFYNLHHPKFSHDIVFCNRIGTPSCLTIHNSVKERFDENLKWFMDSELYKRILDKYGQPIFLHTKEDIKPLMINLHHDGQVTNTSIDKDLKVKEKEYITNKTNDKTLMELVDNSRTDKNTIHAYLELYQKLFKSKKSSANNILEVGLGQRGNCHCGSAKLWFDYFLNADIYAIDIYDESYLWEGIKNKERIKLFTSTNAYNEIEFNEKLLKKNIKFDILLDDGTHILDDMKQFIKLYTQILKDDGILIIEDIPKIEWLDILKNEVPEHLKSYIKTYDLRDKKNRFDDIVFTIDLS